MNRPAKRSLTADVVRTALVLVVCLLLSGLRVRVAEAQPPTVPRHECAKACSAKRQACFDRARSSYRSPGSSCDRQQEAVQTACAEGYSLASAECRQARQALRNCVFTHRRDFRVQLRTCTQEARKCFFAECGYGAEPAPARAAERPHPSRRPQPTAESTP